MILFSQYDRFELEQDILKLWETNKAMHEEDVEAYKETIKGIEMLGRWYFAWGEFQKAVKAARKKL